MPCFHPVKAYRTSGGVSFAQLARDDHLGDVSLPCRQCIGCRIDRAREWTLRCLHEAGLHEANCFVTLTYDDEKLPPGGSLCYRDFQLFMKRLRREIAPSKVRFYMCGEYGDSTWRPHYHALLFGHDFTDLEPWKSSTAGHSVLVSPSLSRLWGLGHASSGPVNPQTVGYVARYVLKKITGDLAESHYEHIDEDGVVHSRVPEFNRMSTSPGVGFNWFARFGSDLLPRDYCEHEGKQFPVPAYYDKLFKRTDDADQFGIVTHNRQVTGRERAADSTPERLAAREVVTQSRMSTFRRNLK